MVATGIYPEDVTLEERGRRLAQGSPGSSQPTPALTVSELYDKVDRVVRTAFAEELWITGEIRSMNVLRNGHLFLDLVDPSQGNEAAAPKLSAKCWAGTWRTVKTSLDRLGIALEVGMVVRARGKVELYKARGTVDFILRELDTEALMGRVAEERARLVQALVDEDLYDRQRRLPIPVVPLRVGLVASQGTEGYHDFLVQLESSGLAFQVTHVQSAVQGTDAPEQLAAAIGTLQSVPVDVIAVVRGGGAKADLAAFDHERVARAVATSVIPVWTGIGHTNDVSVVDEVAQCSHITPTDCGLQLANRAKAAWQRTEEASQRLGRLVTQAADRQLQSLEARRRSVATGTRMQLDRHQDRLTVLRPALVRLASQAMTGSSEALRGRRVRLSGASTQVVGMAETRVAQLRRLLGAYDVHRQLERGWSVTRGPDGAVVRSVADLQAGAIMTTQLMDGTVDSRVSTTTIADHPPTTGAA